MNILIIGSGGREHAIAWKLNQSSQLEQLFIAPGNAGTKKEGTNVNLDITNFDEVGNFCLENKIKIVVVGPEAPLVNGIHDFFESNEKFNSICIIGPKKAAAQLEGSKAFSKAFMKRHNIPTAKYISVTNENLNEGIEFLIKSKAPYVLKADGLAAGKGVLIINNLEEAKSELKLMLKGKFGTASKTVVIEEFLKGKEVSVFVITDGTSYKILPAAKDYKRVGEKDTGLNTGGMGAVSPVSFANKDFLDKVDNQIIIPTIKGLKKEGIDYSGFIFFGIINVKKDPYVIEYNCRLGDPETEVIMLRLKSDLLELFDGVASGTLSERNVEIDPRTATTVMLTSKGYPGTYEKGKTITGLESVENSIVFHSGTSTADDGNIMSNGGRVMTISSFGKDVSTALAKSYSSIEKINFEGKSFRKDIGFDLIKKD